MLEERKKEKHEEQVQFAAYKQFCDDTTVEKQRVIKEANERIEMWQADIAKYEADAACLTRRSQNMSRTVQHGRIGCDQGA